ncbi:IS66 family insertion sequence element accessory protein TnpA, partial [Oceanisphaera ostreae]
KGILAMKTQERRQAWQQHIAASEVSDLSGAAFCKQYDLNYGQFNYWRKKLQQTTPVEPSAGFARVTARSGAQSSLNDELGLHLPSGIRLSGVNAGNLDVVLALLRQL